jgi:hypothetical protein
MRSGYPPGHGSIRACDGLAGGRVAARIAHLLPSYDRQSANASPPGATAISRSAVPYVGAGGEPEMFVGALQDPPRGLLEAWMIVLSPLSPPDAQAAIASPPSLIAISG